MKYLPIILLLAGCASIDADLPTANDAERVLYAGNDEIYRPDPNRPMIWFLDLEN